MMEILNTIWTALTTENEALTNLIGIPSMFVESFIFMLLITTVLNIKTTKYQKILYVLFISICGIFSNYIIPNPYDTFFNLAIFLFSNMLILKTNIFKSIIGLLIQFIVAILFESIFSKIYYFIFKIEYIYGMNIPLHRLIGNMAMYIFILIIIFLLSYFKLNFQKLEVIDSKKRSLLLINFVFAIILIATQLYIITFYIDVLPFFIILLSVISLLTYILISLYVTLAISKLETTSMKLEEAQLYNKTLQILHDNIRAFKHDFWNIVQGIGGYIGKNDMEGLKDYYAQLVEDCQQVNNLTALSPSVVNNPAIYNVLANKYHMADELGIKINLEVFMDLNELNINSYELTRILGILMNNAIEASKECDEKIINVTFRKEKNKHMQLIIVENTYRDKNVDTEKIYEKGYSTKEGNTGLGLWEIRQILKKHNNLNLYTTKNDTFFTQQFEMYY